MAYSDLFKGKEIAEKYLLHRPAYPDEVINAIMSHVEDLKIEHPGEAKTTKMVDVGCGSGQATKKLAPFFDSALGIDISAEQIKVANAWNENDNISFELVSSNDFPVDDNSIDLVSCAAAAHMIDMKTFTSECQRVLKRNGCAALFGYTPFSLKNFLNSESGEEQFVQHFKLLYQKFIEDIEGHPNNALWMDEYHKLFDLIPCKSKQYFNVVKHDIKWTLLEFRNFWSSVGEYQKLIKDKKPKVDPLDTFMEEIKKELNLREQKEDETIVIMTMNFPIIIFAKEW